MDEDERNAQWKKMHAMIDDLCEKAIDLGVAMDTLRMYVGEAYYVREFERSLADKP